MNRARVFIWLLVAVFTFSACGEKNGPDVQLDLTGEVSSAFTDPTVVDLLFIVTNVISTSGILDTNQDGTPDSFAFPSQCGTAFEAQCGFDAKTSAQVNIGQLPIHFEYQIEARFRDASGVIKYSGTAQFSNSGITGVVTIPIASVSP